MENQIKVVTIPVIDYSILDQIALEVKEELAKIDIKSIAPTEDSVSFLKKFRAEKRKQLDEFESSRKAIKKAITEPYDLFNKAYEEKIAKQFKDLDDYLVKAIGEVENGLKETRTTELVAYFSSLITDDLNWLTFDRINLKVNLSDSPKSQKSEIDKFVTKVQDDINLIFTQNEPQRILVRYKTSLNVSQAITSVTDEIKQEEALKKLKAVKIEEPVIEPVKELIIAAGSEPILTTHFKVKGTKNQLIALKKYIETIGLEIVD